MILVDIRPWLDGYRVSLGAQTVCESANSTVVARYAAKVSQDLADMERLSRASRASRARMRDQQPHSPLTHSLLHKEHAG